MIDCEHQWNWDKETRFCLKCRQVRTFPTNGEAGKIVWQGIESKNPMELPTENKVIIAKFAQELGIKKASDCIKIPWKILRAWVGTYCRVKKAKPQSVSQPAPHDAPQSPKSPLSTKVPKSDLLPPFPAFNEKWEAQLQSEWLATYLELARLGMSAK